VISGRNRAESIGKNLANFQPKYCSHKITGITRNRPFPGRTVRPGLVTKSEWKKRCSIIVIDSHRNHPRNEIILSEHLYC
jgi:hypothetical protein